MAPDERILALLQQREALQGEGKEISPEELCAGCPELLEQLQRALRTLERVDTALSTDHLQNALTQHGEDSYGTFSDPVAAGAHRSSPVHARVDAVMPSGAASDAKKASVLELQGFKFIRPLGKGGFGEVWQAHDLILQQDRAVKVLPRERNLRTGLAMLVEEARKMARLPKHRNRVQVYFFVVGETNCYLVMEYVDGGALNQQISRQSPMSWERAVRYAADVADGLAEVHAAGILHRDIKPSNILWDKQRDEALLGDYGISAYTGGASELAGTPGYIAPEMDGGTPSPKSDVFSLAATLYCLVTGEPPFDTRDLDRGLAQARAGLSRPVAALNRVPRAVEEAILSGLEPDPDRRADLPTFTAGLRGAHLQALADKLLELSRRSTCKVNLRLAVSTASEDNLVFRPVPCSADTSEPTSDLKHVPPTAPMASVRTGDLVRLEVTADEDGYLTILNLGSSGQLNVVFPNPLARDNRIRASRAQRLTLKLTPPAGTDRAAVIWTRQPNCLTPAEWRSRIEAGQMAGAPAQEATRGMDFVLHEASEQTNDAWTASVVAIRHGTA
jgi:serine/threonine protein kinase